MKERIDKDDQMSLALALVLAAALWHVADIIKDAELRITLLEVKVQELQKDLLNVEERRK